MYKIVATTDSVESIAIAEGELITFGDSKLSIELDGLDLSAYFKEDLALVRMEQYGHILCFFQLFSESILYDLQQKKVVYSSKKSTEKDSFHATDLTPLGLMVSAIEVGDEQQSRLIDLANGQVRHVPRRFSFAFESGQYLFEKPLDQANLSRIDLDGKTQWDVLIEGHYQSNSIALDVANIRIGNVIGVLEGKLWYQERTGHVCAANVETGEILMRLSEAESILPSGMKQIPNEELWGTFTYRFNNDKSVIYGMGGSLFTEIVLNDENPVRRVIDCSGTLGERNVNFDPCGPDYAEHEGQYVFCDSNQGKLSALDAHEKVVTWSLDLFADKNREKIRRVVEFEDKLFVLAQPLEHSPGKLFTLERA